MLGSVSLLRGTLCESHITELTILIIYRYKESLKIPKPIAFATTY